jgi:tyrosine decarboxylase/aspartate 1-decarboxylase
MKWKKKSSAEIKKTVFEALNKNLNYRETKILGLPATYLDQEQFYFDAPFLNEAPFLSVLIANPNHIGCHANSAGESYFSVTQSLEIDLIRVCAEDILMLKQEIMTPTLHLVETKQIFKPNGFLEFFFP